MSRFNIAPRSQVAVKSPLPRVNHDQGAVMYCIFGPSIVFSVEESIMGLEARPGDRLVLRLSQSDLPPILFREIDSQPISPDALAALISQGAIKPIASPPCQPTPQEVGAVLPHSA